MIDINEKIKEITKPFTPIEITKINEQVVNLALFDGVYPWHKHDFNELFYIFQGEIEIRQKDRDNIRLKEGQFHLVPKGVEHSPISIVPSYVLMFSKE